MKSLDDIIQQISVFVGELKPKGLAPGTIANHVKSVKMLFKVNGLLFTLPFKVDRRIRFRDRAPTLKELEQLLDLGDIREKVIISFLALSGIRIGTLVKLEYRHVKRDLEAGVIPLHIHVKADITKGKYHDYDTFLGSS